MKIPLNGLILGVISFGALFGVPAGLDWVAHQFWHWGLETPGAFVHSVADRITLPFGNHTALVAFLGIWAQAVIYKGVMDREVLRANGLKRPSMGLIRTWIRTMAWAGLVLIIVPPALAAMSMVELADAVSVGLYEGAVIAAVIGLIPVTVRFFKLGDEHFAP